MASAVVKLTSRNFRRFSRGSEIRCYKCGRALKPGDKIIIHGRRRRYCMQCARQLHLYP